MKSIRVRLIGLFVLLVTVILGGFGLYEQMRLSQALEQQFAQRQIETLARLKTSLPTALWNYDAPMAGRIIRAEMEQPEVQSVLVLDAQSRPFVTLSHPAAAAAQVPARAAQRHLTTSAALMIDQSTARTAEDKEIGRVEVAFSRDKIDATLRAQLLTRILEALLLDAILIVVLTYALKMVFGPIAQLRDALFALAAHDREDAEELPEASENEFGEVIRGFNLTQRKLRQVIHRRAQAEEAARQAASQTELAFRDLQAAQASLVQSEKLAGLGGMVAGIAHEINTPVGIVLTSASVLQLETTQLRKAVADGVVRKSDIAAYLELADECSRLILGNADRAAHLIQSFKQVAVDQTSEQRREFGLKEYLDELMTSLHPSLRKAHTEVTVECQGEVLMDSYPGLLAQVITNLTMNAITHAFAKGDGGHIRIVVTPSPGVVAIEFRDDGRGIAEENLGKIFDPFFTTRRGQGGTGLGLNIVFNIVTKQLGGSIAVQNNADRGAAFLMSFPLVTPAAIPATSAAENLLS